MPGVVYRALAKTTYDFSTVGVSTSASYYVAKAIDVSQYREATAFVRIHSYSFTSGGPSIKVDIYPEGPTTEDPANDFIGGAVVATTGTINLSGLAQPSANIQSLSTPFGGYIRIKLTGTQGSPASNPFSVVLSIDVVAKS